MLSQRLNRPSFWIAAAVLLGLGLRTYHYLADPPVWHDEAALIINVLQKDYAEHLGPLYYSEAAPPLFMWLERAVAQVLGDGTLALRLIPWLASCAALMLMFLLGRRLLRPLPLFILLTLLATSDRLLWHSCEAKPYAVDVLLAVVLLCGFVRFAPGTRATNVVSEAGASERSCFGLLLVLALFAPAAIFLSFPACFLLGGIGLALLPGVWQSRRVRVWTAYLIFLAATCVSFALLYLGPIRAQRDERILDCWSWNFPVWDQPWLVPLQLVVKWTEVCRYACEPVGNVLSVLVILGCVVLWRQGQRRLLACLLLPTALASFAWLLGQYPLGPTRVMAFAAPALLLLAALGAELAVRLLWSTAQRSSSLRPLARISLAALVGVLVYPSIQAGYRVAAPWKRADCAAPAAYVLQQRRSDEPVVGAMWEHQYYFRSLQADYRTPGVIAVEPATLPPSAPCSGSADTCAPALWLVVNHDAGTPEEFLQQLEIDDYVIAQRTEFRGIIVSRAVRRSDY